MKKHGTATIHFKVKISLGHIRTCSKKELNTTILKNIILVCCGDCTNISILDPKHQTDGLIVIGNLHFCFGKMSWLLTHMILKSIA